MQNLDQNYRCVNCSTSLMEDLEPKLLTTKQKFLARLPVIILIAIIIIGIIAGAYAMLFRAKSFLPGFF